LGLVNPGCKPRSDTGGATDAAAVLTVAATPTPPPIPAEPPPPRADKASEVPAIEARLVADKAYVAAWTADHAAERGLLLTAASDLLAYGTMHADVDAAVKKAKLSDAVTNMLKVLGRVGKLPADFTTRTEAYLAANKSASRFGTWNPEAPGQPLYDATALAMWLHPNDAGYVRERIHALDKGPFRWRKDAPVKRSWLANPGEVIDRLAALGAFGKQDCLDLAAQWSEEPLMDGGTQFSCKPAVASEPSSPKAPALSPDEEARGPKPPQSVVDGEVVAVKMYLSETLKDPDSYQHDKCSPVRAEGPYWVVDCTYRAKNSFGAVMREARRFFIQKGGYAEEGQVVRADAM
jgi:hypothetical protein